MQERNPADIGQAVDSTAGFRVPEPPARYDTDLLSPAFHADRRARVLEALPDDAVAVLFGAPTRTRSRDIAFPYRQDSNLYYLTGFTEPGAALLLVPGGVSVDGRMVREVLFVPPRDPSAETWTGRRMGAERAARILEIDGAVENTRFQEVAGPVLADPARRVFRLPLPRGVPRGEALAAQIEVFRRAVLESKEDSAIVDSSPDTRVLPWILAGLRQIKTKEELKLLRRAVDITGEAHRAVMAQVEPGWTEYRIEALVESTFASQGAEAPGFPSIVGSGENSTILHYESNRRRTRDGDLVLIDVGAEYHGYSADLTRTIPVNGRFSTEQRAIYSLVLEAQEAGIAAARAGRPFTAVGDAATEVLLDGMAELGLIGGEDDRAGLRRFFMHGTSHFLGLDVHDVGTYGTLRPGMVITVEPGIYIRPAEDIDRRWWNIGVRIEDDVLIGEEGPVLLSGAAPRNPDAIEALMESGG